MAASVYTSSAAASPAAGCGKDDVGAGHFEVGKVHCLRDARELYVGCDSDRQSIDPEAYQTVEQPQVWKILTEDNAVLSEKE